MMLCYGASRKIMKFGLHKGPSGVGRPLVVEVGTLCMLPIAAFRSILNPSCLITFLSVSKRLSTP